MKHIVVAIYTICIFYLMFYTFNESPAFQGGEAGKIVEDIKTFQEKKANKKQDTQEKDQLKALKDKAGSIGKFKVSKLYKSRCASCHGANGNGIIGPKLYGRDTPYIYAKLLDYKMGRIENPVMKGILINVNDEQLRSLSDEIGKFTSAQ